MSRKKPRPGPESLGLPCTGVDHHAHLDMGEYDGELAEVLDRARGAGVAMVGNVFLGPEAYKRNASLLRERKEVFFQLGVHPHDASTWNEKTGAQIEEAFKEDDRLRALGEIGLDFYYDMSPRDVQREVFREQLSLAKELEVPVVIHCREAREDTFRILDDMGFRDRPLMWHCFGGDREFAGAVLERGWHISVPGPVTYSKAMELQEAVGTIPANRLTLETDCPFLAPEPWRGKRNEPAFLAFTAVAVAKLRGVDPAELWEQCGETAKRFFGI